MRIISRGEKALLKVLEQIEDRVENVDHVNMLNHTKNSQVHDDVLRIIRKYRSSEKV